MERYKPITRITKHDRANRVDQHVWNLVGNDPTMIRLRESLPDVGYQLGENAQDVFCKFISIYEEKLYDRLSYN